MPVVEDAVGQTVDRIVLATDFSPASEAATLYAQALAKRYNATLMIAHVIDLSVATHSQAVVGQPINEMRGEAGENFIRLVKQLAAAGIRCSSHTMEDINPAAAIVRLAKRLRADLIVTGTSRRKGEIHKVLGSCAKRLIRHAECPVLTIDPKAKRKPNEDISFEKIVFAADFSTNAIDEAAAACAFARASNAKLYLCHIVDEGENPHGGWTSIRTKAEVTLAERVPGASYEWMDLEYMAEPEETANGISGLASHVNADLIVLGAKRSSYLISHIVSGVVGHVLGQVRCPVMTVRAQQIGTGSELGEVILADSAA